MNNSLHATGSTTASAEIEIQPGMERFLGTVALFCFMVGVPGNLLATVYFVQEHLNNSRNIKKLFFTELYISMTVFDLVLTGTLFPLIENFYTGSRNGVLFESAWFCTIWGLLWEIVPCVSVFLVGLLSISRMLILIRPMNQNLNLTVLRVIVGTYFLYHVLIRAIFWLADDDPLNQKIWYTPGSGYCYFYPTEYNLWTANGYHAGIVLGMPVIPIFVSFVASIVKLRETSACPQNFSRAAQTHATVTIIIVTCLYLVCNIPVLLNYCYYTHTIVNDDISYTLFYSNYSGLFMEKYIWSLTYCILPSINASLNPLVFYLRMKPFKTFLHSLVSCRNSSFRKKGHMEAKTNKEVITTSSF